MPSPLFDTVGAPDDLALALDPCELMRRCGLRPEPWQVEFLEARHPRVLLNVTRQGGKSTSTAACALHDALFRPPATVLILAPSDRQSRLLMRKIKSMYRALGGQLDATRETQTALEFPNGSTIESLPGGNTDTIRGFSAVSLLIFDEAARIDDELFAAATPMVTEAGRIIALSTPHGMRGWWWRAWNSKEDWQRIRVMGEESARISKRKLDEERARMLPNVFASEYECQFDDSATVVFPSRMTRAAVTSEIEPYRPDRPRFAR